MLLLYIKNEFLRLYLGENNQKVLVINVILLIIILL